MKNNLDRIQEFFLKELYIWKRVTDRKDTKSLKFLEKHRSRREWKNSYFLDDKASFSGKEEFRFVPDKIQSQWYLINLCLINRDTLSSTTEIRSFFGRYSIDSVRYVKRWPKNEPLLPFFLSLIYNRHTRRKSRISSSNSTDPLNRFKRIVASIFPSSPKK